MLKKILHHYNGYFATYYIRDAEKEKYIGIVEDHNSQVKTRYFVGWKFENNTFYPGTHQSGKTKMFYTFEDALNYIKED